MKLAISGKGGVGKTTVAALIARRLAASGRRVIAIDADPNANLGMALGVPKAAKVTPLIEMEDLIAERTGAKPGAYGVYFKMNPLVEDIPDKFGYDVSDGVRLMVMGGLKKGGSGCACPENSFLKALVEHLVLRRDEAVVMDMDAGVEHLGRGTARGVEAMLVVTEPGFRSLETAKRIARLARQIGVANVAAAGNKVRSEADRRLIEKEMEGIPLAGFLPYDEALLDCEREGRAVKETGDFGEALDGIFRWISGAAEAGGGGERRRR
ncbi:MAG: AAA family ATPase [Planctomycetota bacterium]|nr:AAA family ATPase [Planctomycetota bacterium]